MNRNGQKGTEIPNGNIQMKKHKSGTVKKCRSFCKEAKLLWKKKE